jgi:hypothetical protein
METAFDVIYKLVSMMASVGIFAGIAKLVAWAVRLEPRIEHVETETAAHGQMIQQFTASQARIEGFLKGALDGKKQD